MLDAHVWFSGVLGFYELRLFTVPFWIQRRERKEGTSLIYLKSKEHKLLKISLEDREIVHGQIVLQRALIGPYSSDRYCYVFDTGGGSDFFTDLHLERLSGKGLVHGVSGTSP